MQNDGDEKRGKVQGRERRKTDLSGKRVEEEEQGKVEKPEGSGDVQNLNKNRILWCRLYFTIKTLEIYKNQTHTYKMCDLI